MAELDYAYLADYAQIENGKISALGASYTHAVLKSLPGGWMTTAVGRVRSDDGSDPVQITVEVIPPDGSFELRYDGVLEQQPGFRAYRGKVGLLFTVTMQMPITSEGLYQVHISLDGVLVRELAFDVEVGP